jgi:hypothetical protein
VGRVAPAVHARVAPVRVVPVGCARGASGRDPAAVPGVRAALARPAVADPVVGARVVSAAPRALVVAGGVATRTSCSRP